MDINKVKGNCVISKMSACDDEIITVFREEEITAESNFPGDEKFSITYSDLENKDKRELFAYNVLTEQNWRWLLSQTVTYML